MCQVKGAPSHHVFVMTITTLSGVTIYVILLIDPSFQQFLVTDLDGGSLLRFQGMAWESKHKTKLHEPAATGSANWNLAQLLSSGHNFGIVQKLWQADSLIAMGYNTGCRGLSICT